MRIIRLTCMAATTNPGHVAPMGWTCNHFQTPSYFTSFSGRSTMAGVARRMEALVTMKNYAHGVSSSS